MWARLYGGVWGVSQTVRQKLKEPQEEVQGAYWWQPPHSTIQEHIDLRGHPVTVDLAKMLCKEDNKTRRNVEEAVNLYKDAPALNRDHDYEIPTILLQLVSRDLPSHME